MPWLAALLAAVGIGCLLPPPARLPPPRDGPDEGPGARPGGGPPSVSDDRGWLRRGRLVWAALAALGGAMFVSGPASVPAALIAGVVTWWVVGRAEPPAVRRRRERMARDLPGLVHLLATALESGCGVGEAVRLVCDVLPGPAADGLAAVPARLALGMDPGDAWRPILDDSALAPLARAMVRAHRSGSSVTGEVARLADELGQRARLRVEERARSVGVKAAVPLGICLLPSFVLIGIVPLVVGLLRSLQL